MVAAAQLLLCHVGLETNYFCWPAATAAAVGKECQKADWKEHKPHCNPTRSGVSAARPTAADGAADAGASSAAVGAGNSAGDA